MASYARRPTVVEAYHWVKDNKEPYPEWLIESFVDGGLIMNGTELFYNGQPVKFGDYIVKESNGVSVRHGQVFEQHYYPL